MGGNQFLRDIQRHRKRLRKEQLMSLRPVSLHVWRRAKISTRSGAAHPPRAQLMRCVQMQQRLDVSVCPLRNPARLYKLPVRNRVSVTESAQQMSAVVLVHLHDTAVPRGIEIVAREATAEDLGSDTSLQAFDFQAF